MKASSILSATMLAVVVASFSVVSVSCTGVVAGLTGETIPTVPVQRSAVTGGAAAIPFQVAAVDVDRAEANPNAVWGLYNAGVVASTVAEGKKSSVATSSGK